MSKYFKFGAMIATSTVVMFFLMYLNTYSVDHVFWSETRAYMALVMGATMAVVMLAFMLGMYPSAPVNIASSREPSCYLPPRSISSAARIPSRMSPG
jgi:hypothetical protein